MEKQPVQQAKYLKKNYINMHHSQVSASDNPLKLYIAVKLHWLHNASIIQWVPCKWLMRDKREWVSFPCRCLFSAAGFSKGIEVSLGQMRCRSKAQTAVASFKLTYSWNSYVCARAVFGCTTIISTGLDGSQRDSFWKTKFGGQRRFIGEFPELSKLSFVC